MSMVFFALDPQLQLSDFELSPAAQHCSPVASCYQELLSHFSVSGEPYAALHAHSLGKSIAGQSWLYANPVSLQPGATAIIMDELELDTDEAEQLFESMAQHLAQDGLQLQYFSDMAWAIAIPDPTALCLPHPATLLQRNIVDALGQGQGQPQWQRLFTECQMLLAQHPVNQARLAQARNPCSALWFYGVGQLPTVTTNYAAVISDDPVAHGLARCAELPEVSVLANNTLVALHDRARLRDYWRQANTLLQNGICNELTLNLLDGTVILVKRQSTWWQRLWRN